MSLDWQEEMSVGVGELDAHHRQLLRRVRRVASAVASGEPRQIRNALAQIEAYLAVQHAGEEVWMEEAGYPAAKEHARAHAGIVERIRMARADAAAGSEVRLVAAADWLARALESHMRNEDVKLGRFWTARQNLRLLAEKGPGVGASLTPIPGMLGVVSHGEREDDAPGEDAPPPLRTAHPNR